MKTTSVVVSSSLLSLFPLFFFVKTITLRFIRIIITISFYSAKDAVCAHTNNPNRLLLCREIIAFYSKTYEALKCTL